MEKMLAAVFKTEGVMEVGEIPKPEIKNPTDVLVKVRAASICGSDLHALTVPPGQIYKKGVVMGHEFYGYVEAVGEKVTAFKPGDCVVIDNVVKCHHCEPCRTGKDNVCIDQNIYGQQYDGGFAQYAVIMESQLIPMPESIPSYLAAQTEPLACVLNGVHKLNITPESVIVVYGAGPIGLTFIRVLKLHNAKVVCCECSEIRQEVARKCNADYVIDPMKVNVKDFIAEKFGDRPDIIIDAIGNGGVIAEAVQTVKPAGTILLFGHNKHAFANVQTSQIVENELKLLGTYCAHNTFIDSINMLKDPRLELEKMTSHRMELKDIEKGMDLLRSQEASRVIIYPNGIVD